MTACSDSPDRIEDVAPLPRYVLVTPARNEAAFLELTIKSVIAQTARPIKWVIVSDGSTDGTDDIVNRYTAVHPWIELIRMPERKERHFAGKVHAFNAGYERVKEFEYDIIGNLDADISFDDEYFQFLLTKFAQNPILGVAGTPFREGSSQYDYRFTSNEHVSGACMLFKRNCFQAIGGYAPLEKGGEDLHAVSMARMKGWQTRTFTEKTSEHHKMTHDGRTASSAAVFWGGFHDYLMGNHPVWQIFRSLYQMSRKPYVIYGTTLFAGYFWGMVTRSDLLVSRELAAFRRKEQMKRLREFLRRVLFLGRPNY